MAPLEITPDGKPDIGDTTAQTAADVVPVCPECSVGKHGNCNGQALNEATDQIVDCECPNHIGRPALGLPVVIDPAVPAGEVHVVERSTGERLATILVPDGPPPAEHCSPASPCEACRASARRELEELQRLALNAVDERDRYRETLLSISRLPAAEGVAAANLDIAIRKALRALADEPDDVGPRERRRAELYEQLQADLRKDDGWAGKSLVRTAVLREYLARDGAL